MRNIEKARLRIRGTLNTFSGSGKTHEEGGREQEEEERVVVQNRPISNLSQEWSGWPGRSSMRQTRVQFRCPCSVQLAGHVDSTAVHIADR